MVRAAKTSDKKVVSQVSAPVVAEATKAPRAKKTKATVEVTAVTTTPVAQETVAVEPPSDASVLSSKMTEFGAKLQQITGIFSTLKNDFKTLEKNVSREMKIAQKASSKRKRTGAARQPSGFVKPTLISSELAEFLGKSVGTEMARTAVSKEINAYIRANSLQDAQNGRKIHPDDKLSKLLKINAGDELTYFNLQRYMKHHFIKQTVVVASA